MKAATILSISALLLMASGPISLARADTADATCEVREDGKVKKDASGQCTFSQRQGYVDIKLANGFTHELSPTDKPNHYKDAKGHKVERTVNGATHVYKWDDKKIIVSFGAPAAGGGDAQVGDTPSDLKDLIGGKKVGGEVDDEMVKRGWKHVKDDVQEPDVWSYWMKGNRCVVVHFDGPRKVQSIVSSGTDCKS